MGGIAVRKAVTVRAELDAEYAGDRVDYKELDPGRYDDDYDYDYDDYRNYDDRYDRYNDDYDDYDYDDHRYNDDDYCKLCVSFDNEIGLHQICLPTTTKRDGSYR